LLSLLVAATPALYTKFVLLNLGERDKLVNGQRHLTLTGWDRKDYSILKGKRDVVVLQMANPDVTDQSLESLKEMKALQELDLSDTQVTDAGLKILKDLPALTKLWLVRTKITDQGFHDTLFAKDSLMRLDLRGTQVSRETVLAWRDAKPGRQVLQ
jgi:Leucine-rich repeat (LRR) protein